MSETTTLLKVGATDLALRMIEGGTIMPDLTLDNLIRAIREVSHDITGLSRVRLAILRSRPTIRARTARGVAAGVVGVQQERCHDGGEAVGVFPEQQVA
jgi:Pup-ligase protein